MTEALGDLPPSAKLVLKVLEVEGAHKKDELIDCTGLPPSTARYATDLLTKEGYIDRKTEEGTVVYAVP
jgi:NAD+ kinase